MDVLECIKARRSVRDYADKEVSWKQIADIVDAARYAPSSGNLQNWKFVVLLDASKREAVAKACFNQMWMAKAPVHIIVVGEPEKAKRYYRQRGEVLYTNQNCAAAAENIVLQATAEGLGSCWVGAFVPEQISRAIGIPQDTGVPQAVITIGYSANVPAKPMKWPLENVCYINGWGGKIKDIASYMKYYSIHINSGINKGKDKTVSGVKTISQKAKDIIDKVNSKIKFKIDKNKLDKKKEDNSNNDINKN